MKPQWSEEALHGLYLLIGKSGIPKPRPNFSCRVGKSVASLGVAWPQLRMGFSFEGDNPGPLARAGWIIVPLGGAQITAIAPLLAAMATMYFEVLLARSAGTAKRTISADEQALLGALLKAGLPMPDRNCTTSAPDGSLSATPDFAWDIVDGRVVKVALELDGWYHHGGRDNYNELMALAAADPALAKRMTAVRKDQQAQDAAKRRMLTDAGWHVVSVLDTELADGKTDEVVATVARLIQTRKAAGAPPSDEPEDQA